MATLLVTWKKMGSEFTYNVLYTQHKDGIWTRYNDIRLTDATIDLLYEGDAAIFYPYVSNDYNRYIITGLSGKTKYYVKIECEDNYYKWWYSYSGYTSLEGGLGDPSSRPSPTYGNVLGFQVRVIV